MVAKTIGTRVSFAWETIPGKRPTTGYNVWCDCTAHPDFNPEADQIETTTLCETYMHTYEPGLVDFGSLGFGSNMTQSTYNLMFGTNGLLALYASKNTQKLRLWVCVDIAGFNKSFYVPVKTQPNGFGLPEGGAGSNKYDLTITFVPAESNVAGADGAGWYDDPTYADETNYTLNISGYVAEGVSIKVLDENTMVVSDIVTANATTSVVLPMGNYTLIAQKDGSAPQIKTADLTSGEASVAFEEFN